MLPKNYPNKITNSFNYIDYKKQTLPLRDDMRSSYVRGHYNIITNDLIQPPLLSIKEPCKILCEKELRQEYGTETDSKYGKKSINNTTQNMFHPLQSIGPQFIRNIHEKMINDPPKPIKQYRTINNLEYIRKSLPHEFSQKVNTFCLPPKRHSKIIYTNNSGYHKYLDPYVTTSLLSYAPPNLTNANGIQEMNHITTWNWLDLTNRNNVNVPIALAKQNEEIVTNRIPIKIQPKIVPNNGLKSEQMAAYQTPIELNINSNIHIRKPLTIPPTDLQTENTEYNFYGSGKRTCSVIS